MKKFLLIISFCLPFFSHAQKKGKFPKMYDLIIGAYTSGENKGIFVYRFYTESGQLAYLSQIMDIDNPSYLCVSNNNKFVYAVNENPDGGVTAFSFVPYSGKLAVINTQKSGGSGPCYISVDKAQKNLFVANYNSGNLTVLPLDKSGAILPAKQVIQDAGQGINKDRQAGPHVHTAVLSPDEKYLLYTDLGTDKLNICRYRPSQEQPLTPASPGSVDLTAGSGPRHIDFSPDKKHVYLVQEMGGMITAYNYDNGKLQQIQTITMVADGFVGDIGAAEIQVSPDGRFLYASNRGDANQIVIYSINQETGQLTFVYRISSDGKTPRNFLIDPTGHFLLVANQNSNDVFVYKIDNNTGKLTSVVYRLAIGSPVCLKLVPVQDDVKKK